MIDLHGRPVSRYHTKLAYTAVPGATSLQLTDSVVGSWSRGDEIVLAATAFASEECETCFIDSVSEDGFTVNLTKPLVYLHLG